MKTASPRITRPRSTLVTVTVAYHTAAMPVLDGIEQQPFEGSPGRVDFHGSFDLRVVGEVHISPATAYMRIGHNVLAGQRSVELPGIVGVGVEIGAIGQQRV